MGKRKSSKKAPVKKSRAKLETLFSCPFCNAERAVGAELDRVAKVGKVSCTHCNASWSTKIHELSEAIDVYRCGGGGGDGDGWGLGRAWGSSGPHFTQGPKGGLSYVGACGSGTPGRGTRGMGRSSEGRARILDAHAVLLPTCCSEWIDACEEEQVKEPGNPDDA